MPESFTIGELQYLYRVADYIKYVFGFVGAYLLTAYVLPLIALLTTQLCRRAPKSPDDGAPHEDI